MGTVIKVENISKQYRLGTIGTGTLSHDLNRWWHNVRGKEDPYLKIGATNDRTQKAESDYVWALRDINFEVQQGDVVGIIGRNGAGKSTLLKILSRTTLPTVGSVKAKGRIASLLEVGTGFHPELTGRENIFLNGAILGMRKHEIKAKFDEIVEFAGVVRYVDTPVKRYSSGMYVRLAFAVAAHLESEILIVDEVLAVGDAEFQKKALGKMKDVSAGEGRTVLFVSHNMGAVKTLCNKGLLLSNGEDLTSVEGIEYVVESYLKAASTSRVATCWEGVKKSLDGNFELRSVELYDSKNKALTFFTNRSEMNLEFKFWFDEDVAKPYRIVISVYTSDMVNLFNTGHFFQGKKGEVITGVTIPAPLLGRNSYRIFCRIDRPGQVYVKEFEYVNFDITEIEYHSFGAIFGNEPGGYFHFPLKGY